MPVYHYKCSDCDCDFETKHGMSYESQTCVECGSTNVFKIPSLSIKKSPVFRKNKPGAIVDNYIKDTKKELKMEKKKLEREGM